MIDSRHESLGDPSKSTPALEVQGLRAGYGSAEVLHDVNLTVLKGEAVVLIGKNGMGKTTLLRTIMALVRSRAGHVALFGEEVTRAPSYRIARRGVSYVPQEHAHFPELSVEENLDLARQPHESMSSVLARLEGLFPVLPQRRLQLAGTLSGGEQKMLALAIGITAEPRLLIVDEITEGLQPSIRDALRDALAQYQRAQGATLLLVEQDLRFGFALANRYAVMKTGRLSELFSAEGVVWQDVANEHLAL